MKKRKPRHSKIRSTVYKLEEARVDLYELKANGAYYKRIVELEAYITYLRERVEKESADAYVKDFEEKNNV